MLVGTYVEDVPVLGSVHYLPLSSSTMIAVEVVEVVISTKFENCEELPCFDISVKPIFDGRKYKVSLMAVLLAFAIFVLTGCATDLRRQEAFGLGYGVGTPYHTITDDGCE
jgi:hypothetical protein